jgi:hypothetical protein
MMEIDACTAKEGSCNNGLVSSVQLTLNEDTSSKINANDRMNNPDPLFLRLSSRIIYTKRTEKARNENASWVVDRGIALMATWREMISIACIIIRPISRGVVLDSRRLFFPVKIR